MTTFDAGPQTTTRSSMIRSPRRVALAALGVVCVGLGLVGVVVPGLPTTIFLIAASYLFARSCPVLEERLIRVRIFRPYLRYLDGGGLPASAKRNALVLMWVAVTVSLSLLAFRGALPTWLALVIVSAAVIGTVTIVRAPVVGEGE